MQHPAQQVEIAAEARQDRTLVLDQPGHPALLLRRGRRCAATGPLQQGNHQLLKVDGFAHMIVHARRQTGLAVGLGRIGGHGDDRQVEPARQLTNTPGGLQAIDIRHLDIHQHRIEGRLAAAHLLDALQSALGQADLGPLAGQQLGSHLAIEHVVLDHQQMQARKAL